MYQTNSIDTEITKPVTEQTGSMRDTVAMPNAHMRAIEALIDAMECAWTCDEVADRIQEYVVQHSQAADVLASKLLKMGPGRGDSTSFARRSILLSWVAEFDNDAEMSVLDSLHSEARQGRILA